VMGQPWQWHLVAYFENYVLKPWLESIGFSRKSCPVTVFESPDVHKKEEGEYWTGLVNAKIQTPQQAADHLGLEYDEAYWLDQERKQQEQFQQKLDQQKEKPSEEPKQNEGRSWKVTEIKSESHDSCG
jgi:hypothetical protein